METSTRELIRDGDEDAFARLFDDYAKSVYNHAFRMTGDWSSAEETMARTFMEAWRLRHKVDPDGGSLRPWLLGIATNVIRNTRRAARRYDAAIARMPVATEAAPDFAEEAAGRLDDADRVRELLVLINRLGRGEREVFALCVWSGLDYRETADALGISLGTVKSRLSRARTKVRRMVEASPALFGSDFVPGREPDSGGGQVRDSRATAARSYGGCQR